MKLGIMRLFPWFAFLPGLLSAWSGLAAGDAPAVAPATSGFQIPEGFCLTLAAQSPLVVRPIVATWDDAGRLVVLEAADVKESVHEQLVTRPHRLVRLVDDNGDGLFDRRIVAAEGLSFPEGVLCIGNATFVAAPPQIWKLVDNDGDGVCEQREVWFDGGTLTHCANDLHGPYLGRDGWIYWCKGAFAEQNHLLNNGRMLKSTASHIFRRRPEGGPLDVVMTGGMDNPVELAFDLRGERFFTSTFLQHPESGRRDGIAHAIYGGVYGKELHVLAGHQLTGPLLPIMTHLGPAAPSGLHFYRSNGLAKLLNQDAPAGELTSFLISSQFNLHKVTAHHLIPIGASYQTQDFDLLVSNRIDFHPTDVLEDADGSLLIVDTGGWYDLCCPSSGIDQAPALGGIYRLTPNQTQQIDNPRGDRLNKIASLNHQDKSASLQLLLDDRWWVRDRAAATISELNSDETAKVAAWILDRQLGLVQRLELLWTLSRCQGPTIDSTLLTFVSSDEDCIAHAAISALIPRRTSLTKNDTLVGQFVEALERVLSNKSEQGLLRIAAEALGQFGNTDSARLLMQRLVAMHTSPSSQPPDRMLEHSMLYGLIELGNTDITHAYLAGDDMRAKRYAAIVQEAIQPHSVPVAVYFALLNATPDCQQWSVEQLVAREDLELKVLEILDQHWLSAETPQGPPPWLVPLISGMAARQPTQVWITSYLSRFDQLDLQLRSTLLEIVYQSRLAKLPEPWAASLPQIIPQLEANELSQLAVWLATLEWPMNGSKELIQAISRKGDLSDDNLNVSLQLLAAIPAGQYQLSERQCLGVITAISSDAVDAATQSLAARILQRQSITAASAVQLLDSLDSVPPMIWPIAMSAIIRDADAELLSRVVQVAERFPAARLFDFSTLKERLEKLSPNAVQPLETLLVSFAAEQSTQQQALQDRLAKLPDGDPLRGMQIFRSEKTACAGCHRIGYVGGELGPNLSRIAASRSRADLLEAILFPSARQEQSYRTVSILTTGGNVISGLVTYEDNQVIELTTGLEQKTRVERQAVERMQPSNVSLMPAGLADHLTPQDLADLLAFLQSHR
jgi:putative membrane-bound dehydrogenase-like protein